MSFPVKCPYCGLVNDQHSDVDNSTPRPGDLSLCRGCTEIAVFTEDGVRKPTPEEVEEFSGEDYKDWCGQCLLEGKYDLTLSSNRMTPEMANTIRAALNAYEAETQRYLLSYRSWPLTSPYNPGCCAECAAEHSRWETQEETRRLLEQRERHIRAALAHIEASL